MIGDTQKSFYDDNGYLVVEDVFSADEMAALRDALDEIVAGARGLRDHDEVYDLEPSHTAERPRVRRIKAPASVHPAFRKILDHPNLQAVLKTLLGPNLRMHGNKLNIKAAEYGSPVEWHQDWAFYPHTNDDVLAVGVMMDDMTLDKGPLMVIPGSHKGPVHDHHGNGVFIGAMDPEADLDYASAVPLTGRAGSCSFHHVRMVHGSAQNRSDSDRRLLLYEITAADAWPLVRFPDTLEAFNANMIAGEPTLEPRLTPVPVRMPLPPATHQGSIYENQSAMTKRFFDFDKQTDAAE